MLAPSLQESVDRFARALEVPQRLAALHPRKQGASGNYAALAPAVALGVIAAFEGFVEDFLATILYLRGFGFGQIAKRVTMNNPTVGIFASKLSAEFPSMTAMIGDGFTVRVWNIPHVNGRPATETIDWSTAKVRADGWMEVRHCLTHGLASGWRSEVWPGPLKGGSSASSVLRKRANGKHSVGMYGAISCARIYVISGTHLADLAATQVGEQLNWTRVPDFKL